MIDGLKLFMTQSCGMLHNLGQEKSYVDIIPNVIKQNHSELEMHSTSSKKNYRIGSL